MLDADILLVIQFAILSNKLKIREQTLDKDPLLFL
jgi:hypothetical protein